MSTLDHDAVREALAELDGWELSGDAIRREVTFDGFLEAIAFITRIAPLAEEANHHPELTNVYNRVTIELTTHDEGGITHKDLDLARAIDAAV
ncbi:MAG: 4a-hydroxytetrahydrobiopterin dehydratase [Nitriliruptoraceae bacterium]